MPIKLALYQAAWLDIYLFKLKISVALHLFKGPKLRTHNWVDREEKKGQHPAGFKTTTSTLCATALYPCATTAAHLTRDEQLGWLSIGKIRNWISWYKNDLALQGSRQRLSRSTKNWATNIDVFSLVVFLFLLFLVVAINLKRLWWQKSIKAVGLGVSGLFLERKAAAHLGMINLNS